MWLFATHFHFMALNVLLAYIPIELSYLLNAEKRKRDWLIGFAWLIFILMRRTYLRIFFIWKRYLFIEALIRFLQTKLVIGGRLFA